MGGQWTSQKVHAGMLWHGRLVRRVLSLVTLLRLPWWPSSLSRPVILGHGTLDDRKEDSLLPDDECRNTEMSSTGNYLPKKWKFHHYLITFMPQCYNEWELKHSSNKKHAKVPKNKLYSTICIKLSRYSLMIFLGTGCYYRILSWTLEPIRTIYESFRLVLWTGSTDSYSKE